MLNYTNTFLLALVVNGLSNVCFYISLVLNRIYKVLRKNFKSFFLRFRKLACEYLVCFKKGISQNMKSRLRCINKVK